MMTPTSPRPSVPSISSNHHPPSTVTGTTEHAISIMNGGGDHDSSDSVVLQHQPAIIHAAPIPIPIIWDFCPPVVRTAVYSVYEHPLYQDHCLYLPAMAGWFAFSAALSTYNKYVFGAGHVAFPCPLLLTSIHFLTQWACSAALVHFFPATFGASRLYNMSWSEWKSVSIPCGLVTSGDIGLSNLSLVTITLTFYTMVKASTPIFVLGWAWLFQIERITWWLVAVVLIIALGEYLTVRGEVDFQLQGFLLCLSASVLSGARWTLVQLKLQTMEPPLQTTIATMRLLAPSMFFSMVLLSLLVEEPWTKFNDFTFSEFGQVLGLGLLGAFFAICMILCEFHLIMYASAVILMIGGVLKEMITIVVGVVFFGDSLNRINIAGCLIVFMGVILYKVSHYLDRKKQQNQQPEHRGELRSSICYEALDSELSAAASGDSDGVIAAASDQDMLLRGDMEGSSKTNSDPLAAEEVILMADRSSDQHGRHHLEYRRHGSADSSGNNSPSGSPRITPNHHSG